jgi:hypothetical protein
MTPPGEDPLLLLIAEAVKDELFVDEASFGGLLLRTTFRIDPIDQNRIRVVYRMEITGAGADEAGQARPGPDQSSPCTKRGIDVAQVGRWGVGLPVPFPGR